MKYLILVSLWIVSSNAMAMQTPVRQSVTAYQAVLDAVVEADVNPMLSISKVSVAKTLNSAKVEFVDQKGNCTALPFSIGLNPFGEPQASLMTDAMAICD